MPKLNPTILILAFVMVTNAVGYGIIIPLLYPLAERLELGTVGLGALMASFSLAQFLATPIIGRLSDRYGRKPLLMGSLFGTGVSMIMLALARTGTMFFAARVLDGLTGGNNSVAQAAVADSTSPKQRASAFALLGAAYGFGFLIGPSIGGLLGQYGLTIPFWAAAGMAFLGVVLGVLFMRETISEQNKQTVQTESLFRWKQLWHALRLPTVGGILLISLLVSFAQSGFIIGVQSVGYHTLHLTTGQFGLLLGAIGLVNIVMQVWVVRWLNAHIHQKSRILTISLLGAALLLTLQFFHISLVSYIVINLLYVICLTPISPTTAGIISSHTNSEDQGMTLGLNQAYISLGTIFGPLVSGLVVSKRPEFTFLSTAAILGLALLQTLRLPRKTPTINV